MRQSLLQISDLENMPSTARRCPATTSQTTELAWLPNQGTFGGSGSAVSSGSQSCSCSAQQKVPAPSGKSNSATRDPQRGQALVSFSCLGRVFSLLPHSFWAYVWFMFGPKPIPTQISRFFAITLQSNNLRIAKTDPFQALLF